MCDSDLEKPPLQPVAQRPSLSRRSMLIATGVALGASVAGWDLSASVESAKAATNYLRPCGIVPVSSSWQGHKDRTPPSEEPGTDYSVPAGTAVVAAASGVIVDRKDSTTTATGRYLALRTDDGNYIRYLHLRSSLVPVGTRVQRGQMIAQSGASGFGSETGYGPHVHVSLWIGGTPIQQGFTKSVDFENYVEGGPIKPSTEDPVPIHQASTHNWNAAIPDSAWTRVQVEPNQFWLAHSWAGVRETGDLIIYLTATGVTKGFQMRVVAETLNASGSVVATAAQPVLEVPATAAGAGAQTFGQYSVPYFLSGPLRLFAEVRALNPGIRVQQVVLKKNYWLS